MKRQHSFFLILILLCLCLTAGIPDLRVHAASDSDSWIVDRAGLLDEDELGELRALSDQLSDSHHIRLAIVTTPDFQDSDIFGIDFSGTEILDWETAYFNQKNAVTQDPAENALLLAVSMADRDWGIQSFGSATDIFDQYAREEIGSRIVSHLSDEDYDDAFRTYLTLADEFLTAAEKGDPYTYDHPYREHIPVPLIILAAFVLSFVISLIIVLTWKKGMNTRIRQEGAGAYLERESFRLTGRSDIFLYHHIARTRIERHDNNSHTHSTSSGTSGKF